MTIEPIESLTPGAYLSLSRELRSIDNAARHISLALLSGNSFSFLEPYLVVECARRGLAITPTTAAFGQVEQSMLDESTGIVSKDTDVIVVALRIEEIDADAFTRCNAEQLQDAAQLCIERLSKAVELARAKSDARILVANFATPEEARSADILGAGRQHSASHIVAEANAGLAMSMAEKAGVYIWDYDGLVASRGATSWTDRRLWLLARQPIAGPNLPYAAAHLARSIAATIFTPAKCLVLDLDNTLWGGTAGDDGLGGIRIGDDHPGNAYQCFQRAVAGLRQRGMLLAIASKNDEGPVREIFDRHPDLVLRWDDFSCHRVNWDAKSSNIRAIAKELRIGLDALVFFDDNPVEREEVRQNAPEVHVIDVPSSPLEYVPALFADGAFDASEVSAEDTDRARYYREEAKRQSGIAVASSMENFLASLDMRATIGSLGPETAARIAQLIGKTNQFNLTTRRHSRQRLQQMADDEQWDVRWLRLADRYGDSGLIGVTIVHYEDEIATIDSFLMSCRVMNRSVDQVMLQDVVEKALERGCSTLRGEFEPTDRNAIVAGLYSGYGFEPADRDGWFELDLGRPGAAPGWPETITRES